MEVYIIRHGQTGWNAKKLMQGSTDTELNEKGRQAAISYGSQIREIPFDCIFASPLKRAYETAALIRGDRPLMIYTDDRLKEMSFGVLEGTSAQVWFEEDNPYFTFFHAPADYLPPEGGETFEDVRRRAEDFLTEVIEPLAGKYERIMIVAHGAINKGLMCHIQNHPIEEYWKDGLQANCQASVFHFDGENWS